MKKFILAAALAALAVTTADAQQRYGQRDQYRHQQREQQAQQDPDLIKYVNACKAKKGQVFSAREWNRLNGTNFRDGQVICDVPPTITRIR